MRSFRTHHHDRGRSAAGHPSIAARTRPRHRGRVVGRATGSTRTADQTALVLSRFADAQRFTLTTKPANGTDLPPCVYAAISQARVDGNNARVWGGMHYPSTVVISDETGAAIANYVNRNAMQRLR